MDFSKFIFYQYTDRSNSETNECAQMKKQWETICQKVYLAFMGYTWRIYNRYNSKYGTNATCKNIGQLGATAEFLSIRRYSEETDSNFWMLNLGNASSNASSRTQIGKANYFLQYIDSKFAEWSFIPGKDICVDKSIIIFKGKIAFITKKIYFKKIDQMGHKNLWIRNLLWKFDK